MSRPIRQKTSTSPAPPVWPTRAAAGIAPGTDSGSGAAAEARHAVAMRLLSNVGRPRSAAKPAANVAGGWPDERRIALFAAALDRPVGHVCRETPQTGTDPGKHAGISRERLA